MENRQNADNFIPTISLGNVKLVGVMTVMQIAKVWKIAPYRIWYMIRHGLIRHGLNLGKTVVFPGDVEDYFSTHPQNLSMWQGRYQAAKRQYKKNQLKL